MNEEYLRHIVRELIPNCHEGEKDKLIEWILKNMEFKSELKKEKTC